MPQLADLSYQYITNEMLDIIRRDDPKGYRIVTEMAKQLYTQYKMRKSENTELNVWTFKKWEDITLVYEKEECDWLAVAYRAYICGKMLYNKEIRSHKESIKKSDFLCIE